jgi:archaellum component FlaC
MHAIEDHIKRVHNKLQQLLKNYQVLQKENEKQAKLINALQQENDNDAQQITSLKEQVNILKMAAGQMDETDKKAFEKNINQYIREIDKCISLLSE